MGAYTQEPFAALLRRYRLEVILEVGSRDGQDALALREAYRPSALHVFEPNPEAVPLCRAALAGLPGVVFHATALWHEAGRIPFYPVDHSIPWGGPPERNIGASSCFRDAGSYGERLVQTETMVDAATLAGVMAAEGLGHVDLLCMDTQGATLNILRGAGPRLANVRFLLTEIATRRIYEGEALFPEVDAFLRNQGFVLRRAVAANDHFGDYLYENPGFTRAAAQPQGMAAAFLARFDADWAPKLLHRAATLRRTFETLLAARRPRHLIVETGCVRKVDGDGVTYGPATPADHPWHPTGWHGPWSDGMSTVLFDRFVEACGGRVVSVDIDPACCAVARAATSWRTTVAEADSVAFLHDLHRSLDPQAIDLLYLDSFDLDWDAPHDSGLHHLQELAAIYARLRPGCLVLVDDCRDDQGREGKGVYVTRFFRQLGVTPLAEGYQRLFRKP